MRTVLFLIAIVVVATMVMAPAQPAEAQYPEKFLAVCGSFWGRAETYVCRIYAVGIKIATVEVDPSAAGPLPRFWIGGGKEPLLIIEDPCAGEVSFYWGPTTDLYATPVWSAE